jgi:hypothetical protein
MSSAKITTHFPVLNNAMTIGDFYVLAVDVVKSGKFE